MCAGFIAAYACWVSDPIIAIDPLSSRDAIGGGDMQINQIPTGLFVSVAVQVFIYDSVFRADNEAGRGGYDPCRRCSTASMIAGWRESIAAIAPEGSHAP